VRAALAGLPVARATWLSTGNDGKCAPRAGRDGRAERSLLSGLPATTVLRHLVELLAWVPVGLFAVALTLVISGAWTVWRLHADPGSVYEER
jgi:hypothetical protein